MRTLVAMVMIGCVSEAEQASISQHLNISKSVHRATEENHLKIAEQNGNYAGFHCDNGDLVVGVVEGATTNDVAEIVSMVDALDVKQYCRSRKGPQKDPEIRVIPKTVSFIQLRAWRDDIFTNHDPSTGLLSLGISNKKNKLTAKVTPGTADHIRDTAAARGIPLAAL